MKTTEQFKETIENYLKEVAKKDELFAKSFEKKNKNIDDCITYILNEVQKSGCNGFDDAEIFGMAMHYFDEDEIEVGKPIEAKVIVNHSIKGDVKVKKEVKKKGTKDPDNFPHEQLSMF